jgi:hypothetical protein
MESLNVDWPLFMRLCYELKTFQRLGQLKHLGADTFGYMAAAY